MASDSGDRVPLPEHIRANRAVAVLRTTHTNRLLDIADVLVDSGLRCIEITFTVPEAAAWVDHLRNRYGRSATVAAGTIHDRQQAQNAVDAGAQLVVGAAHVPEVAQVCRRSGVAYMPGALTPREVWNAWNSGASAVKLFPAAVLGLRGLSALLGPFPDISFVPTGGIDIDDVGAWLGTGATAVGIGSSLVGEKAFEFDGLAALATNAARVAQVARI